VDNNGMEPELITDLQEFPRVFHTMENDHRITVYRTIRDLKDCMPYRRPITAMRDYRT
jgi:hypothetical protein